MSNRLHEIEYCLKTLNCEVDPRSINEMPYIFNLANAQ